jgi:hypothetical protein
MSLVHSTVTGNVAPSFAGAAIFVGTFTGANATLTLASSVVGPNQDFGCFVGPFGSGTVILASAGHNVFTDGSCNPAPTDQIVGDSGLGPLDDNGGPTLTHAVLPGSPALDAAASATCPARDQRGTPRPQGAECDVGAFERVP